MDFKFTIMKNSPYSKTNPNPKPQAVNQNLCLFNPYFYVLGSSMISVKIQSKIQIHLFRPIRPIRDRKCFLFQFQTQNKQMFGLVVSLLSLSCSDFLKHEEERESKAFL
jgi:hypothetical protein